MSSEKLEMSSHILTLFAVIPLHTEKPVVLVSGIFCLFSEIGQVESDLLHIYGTLLMKRPNNTTDEFKARLYKYQSTRQPLQTTSYYVYVFVCLFFWFYTV